MSNIDKQALRQTAEKAQEHGVFNMDVHSQTVLALLDELEALRLANAAQDDHINQQQDRIDLLEKGNNEAAKQINSWRRLAKQNIAEREKDVSELNIARKRIAELEASHSNLREAMAGIHNTITGGGAYTPLAAILNASKRTYEESAAAAGKGE
ncbi:ead/Ea22-like family protein [Enterobacter bugandensis]|uniref:ead/Ea22-like family protein n=1 Tax=Enterobacter bugandensis TaxID=881260 RepID=UPI0030764368